MLIDGSTLRDKVQVAVMATLATRVYLIAENPDARLSVPLGAATRADDTTWKYEWDTRKLPDGEYTIRAAIVDSLGSYNQQSKTVEIRNAEEATEETSEDEADHDAHEDIAVIVDEVDTTIIADEDVEDTDDAEEEETQEDLVPRIDFNFSKQSPISGYVELSMRSSPAEYIEVYAQPKNALTPIFVGRALRVRDNDWKYVWNTQNTPNGEYDVFVRIKNTYGYSDSRIRNLQIKNEIATALTDIQKAQIETYTSTADVLHKEETAPPPLNESIDDTSGTSTPRAPLNVTYIKPVRDFVRSLPPPASTTTDIRPDVLEEDLTAYRKEIDAKLDRYARALRHDDATLKMQIADEIDSLKQRTLATIKEDPTRAAYAAETEEYLTKMTFELRNLTEKNERIIKERVGDAVLLDSDKDSISDYDEVNVYDTDPFIADTDGDGHIDSAEITLGYNPNDSSAEALMVYESAKEAGTLRDDVLAVESIATVTDDLDIEPTKMNKALISGRALPNSFVTLYIYSTPIVVTIKTDESGSWSYLFDKELENGTHEVYVGMTDNAGKIVAKSNPFTFTKTAEAFAPTTEEAPVSVTAATAPSFADTRGLLLVASLSVVALGLVLIILGLYVTHRRSLEQPLMHA